MFKKKILEFTTSDIRLIYVFVCCDKKKKRFFVFYLDLLFKIIKYIYEKCYADKRKISMRLKHIQRICELYTIHLFCPQ